MKKLFFVLSTLLLSSMAMALEAPTITYNLNGGNFENEEPTSYEIGVEKTLPTPTREGHIFAGWFENKASVEKISAEATDDKAFDALWIKIPELVDGCYEISSPEELYGFAAIVNGTYGQSPYGTACGKLTADIEVNKNIPWTPIGAGNSELSANTFRGNFYGQGHSISGLYMRVTNANRQQLGFFGEVKGSEGIPRTISGVKIVDAYFENRDSYARLGGFIGSVYGQSVNLTIEDCSFSGTVYALNSGVGGFIGSVEKFATVTIRNSSTSDCSVIGLQNVGGLIGKSDASSITISNSYNYCSITPENLSSSYAEMSYVGGLVGSNTFWMNGGADYDNIKAPLTIKNSYNKGMIVGTRYIGGLVGYNENKGANVYIENCYNIGEIEGESSIGGLVGYNSDNGDVKIVNSNNKGKVTGHSSVGGILGLLGTYDEQATATIWNSYDVGISPYGGVGAGIVGTIGPKNYNDVLNISNCFSLVKQVGHWAYSENTTSAEDFSNGYVARHLYDWCEGTYSDHTAQWECEEGKLNGHVWSHDVGLRNQPYPLVAKSNPGVRFYITYKIDGITYISANLVNNYTYRAGAKLSKVYDTNKGSITEWCTREYNNGTCYGSIVTEIDASSSVFGEKTFYGKWENTKTEPQVTLLGDKESYTVTCKNTDCKASVGDDFVFTVTPKNGYAIVGDEPEVRINGNIIYRNITSGEYKVEKVDTDLNIEISGIAKEVNIELVHGCKAKPETIYALAGQKLSPVSPTYCNGYAFTGWAKDEAGQSMWNFEKDVITNDTKLYATWKVEAYSIDYRNCEYYSSFYLKKSYTTEEEVTLGKTEQDGYTFEGWFSDENLTKEVTKISKGTTGPFTVYAKWSVVTYDIEYKNCGNACNSDLFKTSYTVEDEVTLKDPEQDGYTFEGWFKDEELTRKVTEISKGTTGNYTVYAKWSEASSSNESSSSESSTSEGDSKSSSSTSAEEVSSSNESGSSESSSSVTSSSSESASGESSASKESSSSKAGSSTSNEKTPSSESKTFVSAVTPVSNIKLAAIGHRIQITGAPAGAKFAILDMQGRALNVGFASASNFEIAVKNSGSYIVRIGHNVQRVDVR